MKTTRGILDSDRLSIIQEYLNGSSKYSLVRKSNLGSSHSITAWMRIFGIEDTRASSFSVMGKTNYSESDELQKLRKELKQIKLALYREKMRADSNETMIDIAEEMFNIPIRKKSWHQVVKRLYTTTPNYSISGLCNLFGVSKQAYYKYKGDFMFRLAKEPYLEPQYL